MDERETVPYRCKGWGDPAPHAVPRYRLPDGKWVEGRDLIAARGGEKVEEPFSDGMCPECAKTVRKERR